MTLPHTDATATITIDGLAVCFFDSSSNTWEVDYLHHDQPPLHSLELRIDNEASIVIPDPTMVIRIGATNPQTPPFPGSAKGFFDPTGSRPDRKSFPTTADELENFRWIINLQDPLDAGHGNATPKTPTFPVTKAFLQNAVLYTSKVASREVFRIPFTNRPEHNPNQMTDAEREAFRFGRTNDEIAGDIYCSPSNGSVSIAIPGFFPQPRVLQHRPNNPWKIRLTNLCRHPIVTTQRFEIGDFQLFYSVVDVTGQKQCIWGEPVVNGPGIEFDAAGFPFTGRVDCDLTWLGGNN